MKKSMIAIVFAAAVCLSAAELAINFKEALAQTPPMSGAVKGWVRNNSSKAPDIGTGEVSEENGVGCFKIETTKRETDFYYLKRIDAKAGQTLEFEITAQGTGYVSAACYSYEASQKFFSPGNSRRTFPLTKEKKVYKGSIKLADGKKGQKLAYILFAVGVSPKSSVAIFDIKARITE